MSTTVLWELNNPKLGRARVVQERGKQIVEVPANRGWKRADKQAAPVLARLAARLQLKRGDLVFAELGPETHADCNGSRVRAARLICFVDENRHEAVVRHTFDDSLHIVTILEPYEFSHQERIWALVQGIWRFAFYSKNHEGKHIVFVQQTAEASMKHVLECAADEVLLRSETCPFKAGDCVKCQYTYFGDSDDDRTVLRAVGVYEGLAQRGHLVRTASDEGGSATVTRLCHYVEPVFEPVMTLIQGVPLVWPDRRHKED